MEGLCPFESTSYSTNVERAAANSHVPSIDPVIRDDRCTINPSLSVLFAFPRGHELTLPCIVEIVEVGQRSGQDGFLVSFHPSENLP